MLKTFLRPYQQVYDSVDEKLNMGILSKANLRVLTWDPERTLLDIGGAMRLRVRGKDAMRRVGSLQDVAEGLPRSALRFGKLIKKQDNLSTKKFGIVKPGDRRYHATTPSLTFGKKNIK